MSASVHGVAAARRNLDELRNRLLAGEPVGVEFAAAVRQLEDHVQRAELDPLARPWVPWIARPGDYR
jgi:hypothetical protein